MSTVAVSSLGESAVADSQSCLRVDRPGLELLASMPGLACVVRDETLAVRWCNDEYLRLGTTPIEELIGSKLEAVMPAEAARERGATMREVLATGQPAQFFQLAVDQRMICKVLPIDSESFGFSGVLATLQRATGLNGCTDDLAALETPCLNQLEVLSPAELRVLHHLAQGRSTAGIGEHLCRSAKTIEKQIESIHRKLKTGSRAELVKLAVERGLHAFNEQEWDRIIEGARRIRRNSPMPRPMHN